MYIYVSHITYTYNNVSMCGSLCGLLLALPDRIVPMVPKFLMGYNETKASVDASLAQLQVDCLDGDRADA